MHRARHAGLPALMATILFVTVVAAQPRAAVRGELHPVAAVDWPASSLVLSEVQTGGATASDEFVEIANQGPAPVDLNGTEVVYVTASGTTITRKATWAVSTILDPGRRVLLANGAGIHAPAGNAVYTGGLAATGGALVLRVVGGAPLDAIGWGDATNAFVEGTVASAPPAGASLERRPGGGLGNGIDTNDNASDWFIQGTPSPQSLSADPVPGGGPTPTPNATATPVASLTPVGTPTPAATPTPNATPTPVASPIPTPTPVTTPVPTATPVPTPTPLASPTPTPIASPTPTPIASPTPVGTSTPTPTPNATPGATPTPTPAATPTPVPTPTPTPLPSPSASPSPTPDIPVTPIADARLLDIDTAVTIEGVLTTDLGAVEGGRGAFIQDATGGIAIYLDAPVVGAWPAGATVRVPGVVGSRYEQRTIRASEAGLVLRDTVELPLAVGAASGTIGEPLEGLRVMVQGTTAGSATTLADGLAITVDDGSGAVRAVIGAAALGGRSIPAGTQVIATGPLGQRDSSGTGTAGYRLHPTLAGELVVVEPTPSPTPPPTPTPTPTPTPAATPTPTPVGSPTPIATPTPVATPSPVATPTPRPTPTPTPGTSYVDPSTARTASIGSRVAVRGTVTAEVGRLGSAPLFAIGDANGGILIRLPDGAGRPTRGAIVEVRGQLADPYGQIEVRPAAADLRVAGTGTVPAALPIPASGIVEPLEGRLVTATGVVAAAPSKSGSSIVVVLERVGGADIRVMVDDSSGLDRAAFAVGSTYRVTGIAGQRASRKDAPDGYRLWLRDVGDLQRLAGPAPTAGSTTAPGTSAPPSTSTGTTTIARALGQQGLVAISGVVTAPATLLDATGRRIVVQDGSGAVEVLVPPGSTAPSVGTSVRVVGTMGRAYGAPRLGATALTAGGRGSQPQPIVLHAGPSEQHEWRLVRIKGTVSKVSKLGERWRAEIRVGGTEVVVTGQAGAGIAHDVLTEDAVATVVGIVRRPYPTASDQRFTILPRFASDVGTTGRPASARNVNGTPGSSGGRNATSPTTIPQATSPTSAAFRNADLVDLANLVGQDVRVGGLVIDLVPEGFTLDDGTGSGTVHLLDEAAELVALVEPGDAVNATGTVELLADGPVVVVRAAAGLSLAGDIGGPAPSAAPRTEPTATSMPGPDAGSTAAGLGDLPDATPGLAGVGTILAVTMLSIAVTGLRRWQARRRLAVRVATRLAQFAGAAPVASDGLAAATGWTVAEPARDHADAMLGPRSAAHESRTAGSA